jgi:hypothetical protein
MYENNHKTLHDLTVEDVETAAKENAERYEPMFKKAAKAAFIEGIMWAQKTHKEGRLCSQL